MQASELSLDGPPRMIFNYFPNTHIFRINREVKFLDHWLALSSTSLHSPVMSMSDFFFKYNKNIKIVKNYLILLSNLTKQINLKIS
jgi:hypothetical protein